MSPDIEKLRELIKPAAVVAKAVGRYGDYKVTLVETQEAHSSVGVDGLPEDAIVFNVDDFFPAPDKIFAGSKNECCRSDYVFVSDGESGKNIVFAEVKTDNPEKPHIKDQLRGSTAFVYYCKSILEQFWAFDFPLEQYKLHYVAFLNTAKKCGTRQNHQVVPVNDSVDAMMKLEGGITFRYNHLIQYRR